MTTRPTRDTIAGVTNNHAEFRCLSFLFTQNRNGLCYQAQWLQDIFQLLWIAMTGDFKISYFLLFLTAALLRKSPVCQQILIEPLL